MCGSSVRPRGLTWNRDDVLSSPSLRVVIHFHSHHVSDPGGQELGLLASKAKFGLSALGSHQLNGPAGFAPRRAALVRDIRAVGIVRLSVERRTGVGRLHVKARCQTQSSSPSPSVELFCHSRLSPLIRFPAVEHLALGILQWSGAAAAAEGAQSGRPLKQCHGGKSMRCGRCGRSQEH